MKLQELKPNKGSIKRKKRVGRGNGSGLGTYSGRGMNGQNCRAGGGVRAGFEGGQTPLILRMPKLKGFRSPNKKTYQVVNLTKLNQFKNGAEVNTTSLLEKGLIAKKDLPVKILGMGDLEKKLKFNVEKISETAKEKILKAGGEIA